MSETTIISTQLVTERVTHMGSPMCSYEFENETLCRAPAVRGLQYCRQHIDDAAPLSTARYVEGRYQPHVPRRMLADFKRARRDTDLLQLEDNIALFDARILYLCRQAEKGDTEYAWDVVKDTFNHYRTMLTKEKATTDDRERALLELEHAIKSHVNTEPVWDQIRAMSMEKKLLVESERRRRESMEERITLEDSNARIQRYFEIVQQFVTDRGTLSAIASAVKDELDVAVQAKGSSKK